MKVEVRVTVVDEDSAISDCLKSKEVAYISIHGDKRLVEKIYALVTSQYPTTD